MLFARARRGHSVPPEDQTATRVFNDFQRAFELTETKRSRAGDPLPKFLQSMRAADPDQGRPVDEALWRELQ